MTRSTLQTAANGVVTLVRRMPPLYCASRHPFSVRAGYLAASAIGYAWGAAMSAGRIEEIGGVIVARDCPRWAFGRGGTTIGAVYLTAANVSAEVLAHEAVHRQQWRRYGLGFALLYLAAGPVASENRFEVEAGLERGGYR